MQPSRPSRGAVTRHGPRTLLAGVGALTVALLLASPVDAGNLGEGFHTVTDAGAGLAALHGSLLAWAGADHALHLTDLQNGTSRVLTSVPPGARVQSLAFDGTWVAWCDTRFGNSEAFALEVHQLAIVRLSKDPASDTDITVGGGHAAWLRDGEVVGSDLASPAERRLSVLPGLAFTPSLDGDRLVWSQIVGNERHLAGLQWGHNATLLTGGNKTLDTDPVAAGGRVAWRSQFFSAPLGTPGSHLLGSRIQVADFTSIKPLVPRAVAGLGGHDQPALGGAWVLWLETAGKGASGLTAVNLATFATFQILAPVDGAMVSDSYVVVTPGGGSGLQARPWSSAKATESLPVAGMAAAVLVACVLRRRASS